MIVTVINAKGGCGKSTIAMNLAAALAGEGYRSLLINLDPQAQVTAWLNAGDGLTSLGTIVRPMAGKQPMGGGGWGRRSRTCPSSRARSRSRTWAGR